MIPHICSVMHNPPQSYGDCLRAVMASYFSIDDMETVPHFYMSGNAEHATDLLHTWLAERGLRMMRVAIPGDATLDEVFAYMSGVNTDIEYLLFCNCADNDHVVICCNDQVIHNPQMYKSYPQGPSPSTDMWIVAVFVPIMGD